MTDPSDRGWRVFPWDPEAVEGERFSPTHVSLTQGQGRFDLPGVPGGVLYLAETAAHAAAEMIQHYRGHVLDELDLRVEGHVLALVAFKLPDLVRKRLVDLCDPEVLIQFGIRPDETASLDRQVTQRISSRVFQAGHAGLRWWSALTGDWHTVVLFRERLAPQPELGKPEPLTIEHPAVVDAARMLGIRRTVR